MRKKKFLFGFTWGALAVATLFFGISQRHVLDYGSFSRKKINFASHSLLASQTPNIPESDLFFHLSQLLREKYVDEVPFNDKLALGAIRGMVTNLTDPNSTFMNPKQFEVFQNAQKGIYEGIGVETQFYYQPEQLKAFKDERITDTALFIPSLKVLNTVPGGSAQKAGLQAGDLITHVNGHWVLSYEEIYKLREGQKNTTEQNKEKLENLKKLRKQINEQLKTSLTPAKARELLTQNKEGHIKLTWIRGNQSFAATLPLKQITAKPVVLVQPQTIHLNFYKGADQELKKMLPHLSKLTIDLQTSTKGDFKTMQACLEILAPRGTYGKIIRENPKSEKPLEIKTGNPHPPKIKLLIDSFTQGPAKVFALALSSRKKAELVQKKGVTISQEQEIVETFSLPEGNGYTLTTAIYKP